MNAQNAALGREISLGRWSRALRATEANSGMRGKPMSAIMKQRKKKFLDNYIMHCQNIRRGLFWCVDFLKPSSTGCASKIF